VLLISKVTANKGVAEMATEFAVGEWLTEPEKCSKNTSALRGGGCTVSEQPGDGFDLRHDI